VFSPAAAFDDPDRFFFDLERLVDDARAGSTAEPVVVGTIVSTSTGGRREASDALAIIACDASPAEGPVTSARGTVSVLDIADTGDQVDRACTPQKLDQNRKLCGNNIQQYVRIMMSQKRHIKRSPTNLAICQAHEVQSFSFQG
jgi:hypothetical protein